MNIASILRHWFTLLATLLTGWLILPAEQQAELTKALGDLVGPLVIIITLIVTATWRLVLAWLGNLFGRGAGVVGKSDKLPSWLIVGIVGTAAGLGGLPSCSPAQMDAARGIPIKGCLKTDQGTVCYFSKGGLTYEVDTRSAK